MSEIANVLKSNGVNVTKLLEEVHKSREGQIARELGNMSYNAWQDNDYVKIRGDHLSLRETLTAAQTILEDLAMKNILTRRLPQ